MAFQEYTYLSIPIDKVIFIDIETVPQYRSFEELPEAYKKLWTIKTQQLNKYRDEPLSPEESYDNAGIYSEYGKIICICVGRIKLLNEEKHLNIKAYFSNNEKELISDFFNDLQKFNTDEYRLCAHNGKEFDFPYIARRAIINNIPLIDFFSVAGRKPWQTLYFDTLELWKFGDNKSYTSLELLATVLNIDTPKDDISGKDVKKIYYEENDLIRIARYCSKDVITIAQIFLKLRFESLIKNECMHFLDNSLAI
ncbi:MAG: ribonuclease H-like domain-containing protein [Bacteroidales bacterium]|nr:ribonuclease H-like domain-containing protein [Bacteroidales bacterium]